MSGGHFGYQQYKIEYIAEIIEDLIGKNNDTTLDEWGDKIGKEYSKDTIAVFLNGLLLLKLAYIYAQRIDWLVSGDDSEDSFHRRLKKDLEELK